MKKAIGKEKTIGKADKIASSNVIETEQAKRKTLEREALRLKNELSQVSKVRWVKKGEKDSLLDQINLKQAEIRDLTAVKTDFMARKAKVVSYLTTAADTEKSRIKDFMGKLTSSFEKYER